MAYFTYSLFTFLIPGNMIHQMTSHNVGQEEKKQIKPEYTGFCILSVAS